MAIQYGVPFYPGFVNNDTILGTIAKGPQGVIDVSKLFDSYKTGAEFGQQQGMQNLYSNLDQFRDAQGRLDIQKMSEALLQQGGGAQLGPALNAQRAGAIIDYYRNAGQDEGGYPGKPPADSVTPPTTSDRTSS